MADVIDLADKIRYAICAVQRIRALTPHVPRVYDQRVLARTALVYVHAAIPLLQRLNNLAAGREAKNIRPRLKAMTDDFERDFSIIRHRITAHRQTVDLLEELDAWRKVHDDCVAWFETELIETYETIRSEATTVPQLLRPTSLTDTEATALRNALAPDGLVRYNQSAQALAGDDQTSRILPAHEVQRRGQDLWAIYDAIGLALTIVGALHNRQYARLFLSVLATEFVAFFDTLYDDQNPSLALRERSFLDILRDLEDADESIAILDGAQAELPLTARDRTLRNRIGAHIDADRPLPLLISDLDAYDFAFVNGWYEHAFDAYFRSLHVTRNLRSLAIHRRVLTNVISVHQADPAPPYHS